MPFATDYTRLLLELEQLEKGRHDHGQETNDCPMHPGGQEQPAVAPAEAA